MQLRFKKMKTRIAAFGLALLIGMSSVGSNMSAYAEKTPDTKALETDIEEETAAETERMDDMTEEEVTAEDGGEDKQKEDMELDEAVESETQPEVTITSVNEQDTEEDLKQLEQDIEDGNVMIFSAAQAASGRSASMNVQLVKGRDIYYPSYLGNYNTCEFFVNGKIAYCIESHKTTPPNGSYIATVLNTNTNLQKALYYGYGGAMDLSGSYLVGKSPDERYIYTHIAASYAYAGNNAFAGCSYNNLVNAGVIDYIDYLFGQEEPPQGDLSLSEASVQAFRDGTIQKTSDIKLNGDYRNYITITVPENVTIHNRTKGTSKTNGSLQVYGGDVFYLAADLAVTGNYFSGNLHGYVGENWRTLVVSTGQGDQNIGLIDSETAAPVKFSVDWIEVMRIDLVKKDSDTQNVLSGAVYGIYTDKQCSNLLLRMPATGADGVAVSDYFDADLEKVYVKEVTAPVGYVKNETVYTVNVEAGKTVEVSAYNDRVKGRIHIQKIDFETEEFLPQGDSVLTGAVYGLYAKEDIVHPDRKTGVLYKQGSLIARGRIQKDGTLDFTDLYLGKMFVKEITPPQGYLLDSRQYDADLTYEGQDKVEIRRNLTVSEQVKKQAFQIIKISEDGDQTETDLVEGAGFKVYLVSSLSKVKSGELRPSNGTEFSVSDFRNYDFSKEQEAVTYEKGKEVPVPELITDSKGYAVSPELPYGLYVVEESTVPKNLKKVDPFLVRVNEDSREPMRWRVFDDRPFEFLLKIEKKDAQTGNTVLKAGASYRIYDCEQEEYVEQVIQYPKKEKISVFKTNEEGYLVTPEELIASTYRIEEIKAPDGFVRQGSEMALYDEMEIISAGVVTENGEYRENPKKEIEITIASNTVYQIDPDTGAAIVKVEQANDEQVGSLTLTKTGEQLVRVSGTSVLDEIKTAFIDMKSIITGNEPIGIQRGFVYEEAGVEGAKFELYAKDIIYSPDGAKNEDGSLVIRYNKDELVAELVTDEDGKAVINNLPLGTYYLKETEAGEHFVLNTEIKEFTLTAEDDTQAVVYEGISYKNERQRVKVTVKKKDAVSGEALEGVVFGLYAAEDIESSQGKLLIEKDTLLETKATDENGTVTFDSDLFHDSYYVKEEQRLPGYLPNGTIWRFEVVYTDQNVKVLTFEHEVENQPTESRFIKKDATTGEGLPGAKLQIIDQGGRVVEEWISTKEPHVSYGLQEGTYILHEELAPYKDGYVTASDITFDVFEDGTVAEVEMEDEYSKVDISKTDLITGKALPGATLQILDKDGNILEEWVSKNKPHRIKKLPVGEKLILHETAAPDGYAVAKDIRFKLEDTGEVQKVELKNSYSYGKIMLVKTDADTGKALAGAEFEIRNKTTGEVIETLITKEGGKAESGNLLIGTYGKKGLKKLFEYEVVETKAPEGYELDKTIHSVQFKRKGETGGRNVVTLEVKNKPVQNQILSAPKTGDSTGRLAELAVICIGAMIAFAMATVKKRKEDMSAKDTKTRR